MLQDKPFLNSLEKSLIHKGRVKLFITFVAISFTIWFFKKFSKVYQEEIDLKIEIVDVPQSYTITNIIDPNINFNLKATGFQFLYYYFIKNKIKISLDKANYNNGKAYLEVASEFNKLQDQFMRDTQILSFFPTTIELIYQPKFSKKVPVSHPKLKLDVGYSISKFILNPDSILVTGPKDIVEKINFVNLNFKNETSIKFKFFR